MGGGGGTGGGEYRLGWSTPEPAERLWGGIGKLPRPSSKLVVQHPPPVSGADWRPPPGHVVRAAGASEEPAQAPSSERYGRGERAGELRGRVGAGGEAGEGGSRRRRGLGPGPWRALRAWSLRPGRTVERNAARAARPLWSRPLPLTPSCSPRSLPPLRTSSPAPSPARAPMRRGRRAPVAPRPSRWPSPSPRCTQRCAPWGYWATCSSCSASSGESAAEWCHGRGPG